MKKSLGLTESIGKTVEWILSAKHIVVFTGAGLSTASGLPDFRGPNGLWNQPDKDQPSIDSILPGKNLRPNDGHYAITELEKYGKVQFLISQNIDGFHLDSGFPHDKLAELHGNTNIVHCQRCKEKYSKKEVEILIVCFAELCR